jgi:hypothetical protein
LEEDRLDKADHHLQEALAFAQRLGHRTLEFMTLCNLGLVCERRGDLVAAVEKHRAAVAGAGRLGDVRVEAQLRSCLGSALARLGEHDEARLCLDVARERLATSNDKVSRGLVLCSAAENELLDRHPEIAADALKEASAMLAACDDSDDSELSRRVGQVRTMLVAQT